MAKARLNFSNIFILLILIFSSNNSIGFELPLDRLEGIMTVSGITTEEITDLYPAQDKDGNLFLVGLSLLNYSYADLIWNYEILLIHFDKKLNVISSRGTGIGTPGFSIESVYVDDENNIIILSRGLDSKYIIKIDSDGNLIYKESWKSPRDELVKDLILIDKLGSIYVNEIINTTKKNNKELSLKLEITKYDSSGSKLSKTALEGSNTTINDIKVDKFGNIIIVGATGSSKLTTLNSFQSTLKGNQSGFISKFNDRLDLVFGTYIGGSRNDSIYHLQLDNDTNIIVMGYTNSTNFPTKNAFQASAGGKGDAFLSKFNSNGLLIFSSYLGGSNAEINLYDCDTSDDLKFQSNTQPSTLRVDDDNNIIAIGWTGSENFPTKNASQSTLGGDPYCHLYDPINFPSDIPSFGDNFVTKINRDGSLNFSTYLGGFSYEASNSIVLDSEANIYFSGVTRSNDFPVINPAQGIYGGDINQPCICEEGAKTGDIFVAKLTNVGNIEFSTFIGGGHGEEIISLQTRTKNELMIFGKTRSMDFPITIQTQYSLERSSFLNNPLSPLEYFILRLDSKGKLLFSTFTDTLDPRGIEFLKNHIAFTGGGKQSFQIKDPLRTSQNLDERGIAIEGSLPLVVLIYDLKGNIKRGSYVFRLPKDEVKHPPNYAAILIGIAGLVVSGIIVYELRIKRHRKTAKPDIEDLDQSKYKITKKWL